MYMKKIGVLGSGIVGQTLASGFLKHGYEVMIGSRDTAKLAEWLENNPENSHLGSFEDTAAFAEIIVLAVKGTAVEAVLEQSGEGNLNGKIIIDATNPIADAPPVNGVLQFFTDQNSSLMEKLQGLYPKANFVKAFNSVSFLRMVNPDFEVRPTMFICGNDGDAKKEVSKILDQFGWEVEDFGAASSAGPIEGLCQLYCIIGLNENRWTQAFKLLQ
ncbi:MAG: NAD(P)-binding domain-containing protein [Eudoraea sp.]|nr:NAD(P)-binding domain-containing protein [Eudoraea sp.]